MPWVSTIMPPCRGVSWLPSPRYMRRLRKSKSIALPQKCLFYVDAKKRLNQSKKILSRLFLYVHKLLKVERERERESLLLLIFKWKRRLCRFFHYESICFWYTWNTLWKSDNYLYISLAYDRTEYVFRESFQLFSLHSLVCLLVSSLICFILISPNILCCCCALVWRHPAAAFRLVNGKLCF